jgi:hypothetical protein
VQTAVHGDIRAELAGALSDKMNVMATMQRCRKCYTFHFDILTYTARMPLLFLKKPAIAMGHRRLQLKGSTQHGPRSRAHVGNRAEATRVRAHIDMCKH